MIGRLRGMLVSNREGAITVDVDGVGYEARMTPRDLSSLPGLGEEIVIHTHTYVREDEISLYGFAIEGDRELFRILISASGVGPKLAMAMLGSMTAEDIVRAIVTEDPDALTVAPGVGKRGGQKIVLELGPKLAGRELVVTGDSGLASVRQALEGLGYTNSEINDVVGDLNPNDPIEVQIRVALQRLGKK